MAGLLSERSVTGETAAGKAFDRGTFRRHLAAGAFGTDQVHKPGDRLAPAI
jgi:hypothetical protein